MNDNNLGPLPKGGRSDNLQQLSLDAFRAALPKELFLFRDERVDDKGVDGSLELKRDDSFLNIRSQCQLKGTDDPDLNKDDSYSHAIETSNLNYLLNGPSPLYVVWIAPRNELRYVWARNEARRLHRDKPDWMNQDTVTLRFTQVLSTNAVQEIYDRILREGRMQRETHDILARATITEPVIVGINPQSLAVTDPDKINELLLSSGLSLVASGFAAEVLGLLPFLKPGQAAETRIQLVTAYAHMTKGDYLSAGGYLAHCALTESNLSVADQHFLATLRNACDYHTGRIDYTEYIDKEKQLAKSAPPGLALQHELETLRLEHLNSRDFSQRSLIWESLRATTAKIAADASASRTFKLHARLTQLYADAIEADAKYIHQLIRLSMRKDMGFTMGSPQVLEDLRQISDLIKPLIEEANLVTKEAIEKEHPLLYAEALTTQAIIMIAHTSIARFFLASLKQNVAPIPQPVFQQIRQGLEEAARMFARAGSLEGEIRAKLTMADWLEVAGDVAGAREIAQAVRGPALAMGYEKQISRAEEHISGNTEQQKLMAVLTAERDMDAILAQATDEQMDRFAEDCLEAMHLPKDRLAVVQRESLSLRDIAREQMHWCRHLGLMQDLRHTLSPQTSYARDPNRMCICTKFNYKSKIEDPDWKPLLVAFKRVYCAGCNAKEPKTGSHAASS